MEMFVKEHAEKKSPENVQSVLDKEEERLEAVVLLFPRIEI